jgi:hypothetical protein
MGLQNVERRLHPVVTVVVKDVIYVGSSDGNLYALM